MTFSLGAIRALLARRRKRPRKAGSKLSRQIALARLEEAAGRVQARNRDDERRAP